MPITARCPGCGQTLSVQDQYAGMQGKCPSCNTILTFPGAPMPAVAPVPLAPLPAETAGGPVPPPLGSAPLPAGASAPLPASPSLPMDPLLLTYIGLGVGTFFYLLLLTSPFLSWRSGAVSSAMFGTELVVRVAGTNFGDGRMLFCLTLIMLIVVALNFLDRRFLPQAMVLAGAFATFAFLMMLGRVGGGGAGIFLGLVGALGAAAGCLWTAVRQPFIVETPFIKGAQSFFSTYGALLAAEAVAFVFGVLYWLLRAIFAVG